MTTKTDAAGYSDRHCGPGLLIAMVAIVAVVLIAMLTMRSDHHQMVPSRGSSSPATQSLHN